MSEDSDSELMRRVRGGRTSALATLFRAASHRACIATACG